MSEKKLHMQVNGEAVTCNFGVNWFYKFVKEVTGQDLLSGEFDMPGGVNGMDMVVSMLYAGYLSECKVKKVDSTLTAADFEYELMSRSPVEFGNVTKSMWETINPGEQLPPPETKQPEPGSDGGS